MKINNHHYCRVAIILSYDKMGSSRRQEKKSSAHVTVAGRMQGQKKLFEWQKEKKKLKQPEIAAQKNTLRRRRHRGKQKR